MTIHHLDEVLEAREIREAAAAELRKAAGRVSNGITGRVERGAALLDEKRPGWWQEIDLKRLDIGSNCNCVCGQLGGYLVVLRTLGVTDTDSEISHGFEADGEPGSIFAGCYALTEAWRSLILGRRELAGASA